MYAYKAFDFNLRDSYGNRYEFDKWYTDLNNQDYLAPHEERGFHACVNPWDTMTYFRKTWRVTKIEVEDYVFKEQSGDRIDGLIIAQKIKIVEDVKMDLNLFDNNEINWNYVSSNMVLTKDELSMYKEYINFKRYKHRKENRYMIVNETN